MEGNIENKDWFLPPVTSQELADLKGLGRIVYLAIKSWCGKDGKGECWAAGPEIAERAGVSEGTVSNKKKILIEKGKIKRVGKRSTLGGYTDILRLSVQQVNPSNKDSPKKSSGDEPLLSKRSPSEVKRSGGKVKPSGYETNTKGKLKKYKAAASKKNLDDGGSLQETELKREVERIYKERAKTQRIDDPVAYKGAIRRGLIDEGWKPAPPAPPPFKSCGKCNEDGVIFEGNAAHECQCRLDYEKRYGLNQLGPEEPEKGRGPSGPEHISKMLEKVIK